MLILFFGFAAKANAAANVYYSVGQNTNDHRTCVANDCTANPLTVTIDALGNGTFSTAQATSTFGVGDQVTYGGAKAYISAKQSTTVWNFITATGTIPVATTTATVTKIAHAFSSLAGALPSGAGGAKGASYLNTTGLVAGNFILNIPCYYDTGADTTAVTISGWTTGVNNYINIYTPSNTSIEVNQSQRHSGVWDSGKYSLEVASATALFPGNDDIRISGLQIYSGNSYALRVSMAGAGDTRISSNIIKGSSTDYKYGIYLSAAGAGSNLQIWNNIIYDFTGTSGTGIFISNANATVYAYNNTVINSRQGIDNNTAGTVIAKNNLVKGSIAANTYMGTFATGTDYNATESTDSIGAGSNNRVSQTFSFFNEAGKDFHLTISDTGARNNGEDLSSDTYLPFTDDIDGETRPGSWWDIGADELISSDITAPAGIIDLAASSPTTSSVTLTWTAPGDDNNTGTATSYDVRYSTSNITDGNWASATQAIGESAPQVAGSSETFIVNGLNSNTTYYFAIKTSDEVPNTSGLSNVVSGATLPDTTAPAAISNLAVSATSTFLITLSWTAPGDDNNTGTATSYDVRYSTSNITDGNWASATQAIGESAPQVAGSSETFTVTGLTASTTYYFAVKTSDEVPNTSGISNIKSVSTKQILENLTEIFRRKDRISTNSWPKTVLEDSSNHYIWQPETLMYYDVTTGKEVWKMSYTPDLTSFYQNSIGVSPWSADGKRFSFASARTTQAFTVSDTYIWMTANTDGSKLRPMPNIAGKGYNSYNNYFHWSPQIPDTFYEVNGSTGLYKTVVADNSDTSQLILTYPGTIRLDKMISGDGRKLLVSSYDESLIYPTTIYPTANIDDADGYSIDRGLALYGTTPASYNSAHDRYYAGDGAWYFIMPTGGSNNAWWRLKSIGSAADGGALCNNADFPVTDPTYNFGECWPVNAYGGTNPDPFGSIYWSHFVPDRWGRFALFSNGATDPPPNGYGPGTWNIQNKQYSVYSFGGWSQHHDWHGFTDWTVSSRGTGMEANYLNERIYLQKYNDVNSQITLNYTHTQFNDGTAYNTLTRPGQSPDGTKVAWHSEFLNQGADKTDIFWTVAYYPYPATDLSAHYNSGVEVAWLPPKYTDRGWPYASSTPTEDANGWPILDGNGNERGEPLYAREIKKYHVWRSLNGTSSWQEIGSTTAQYSTTYAEDPTMFMLHPIINGLKVASNNKITFIDNPGNGTYYYAVTSEEYSGLESNELSEILKVIVSGSNVTTQVVQAKGQANFWTAAPLKPNGFSFAAQSTPGQYLLSWVEPNDSKVRYYNIYYSNASDPTVSQANRIASLPLGTTSYLDWLADKNNTGYYGITSVDRYGNESAILYQSVSDLVAPTISAFTVPSTASSTTINITSFSASDNNAVTGYLVNESNSTPTDFPHLT